MLLHMRMSEAVWPGGAVCSGSFADSGLGFIINVTQSNPMMAAFTCHGSVVSIPVFF